MIQLSDELARCVYDLADKAEATYAGVMRMAKQQEKDGQRPVDVEPLAMQVRLAQQIKHEIEQQQKQKASKQ